MEEKRRKGLPAAAIVIATMRHANGRNQHNREALEQLAKEESLPLHVVELDVTGEQSVQRAIAAAVDCYSRLDVVINNAGFAAIGITQAYTAAQFQQMFDSTSMAWFASNRAALPTMRQQKSGLFIHVSSAAGRATVPAMGAYCASKFALQAIADAYRFELLPFGIDSVLGEPGR